jgi:hypothetical protein
MFGFRSLSPNPHNICESIPTVSLCVELVNMFVQHFISGDLFDASFETFIRLTLSLSASDTSWWAAGASSCGNSISLSL